MKHLVRPNVTTSLVLNNNMSSIANHLSAGSFMLQIKKYLFFRLHEHIKMDAPLFPKGSDDPDMTIICDTGRILVYFYFADLSNANEVGHKEQYLAAMMKNPDVLFGVITDKQKYLIYEIDVNNGQLKCKGHFSLAQMCHYFNSFWIDLDVFPPLEVNDYSYTKSGGAADIIVDKLDAAYLFGSQTAVASGVVHPILLTYDMLTTLLGFQPNSNGDFELNGFVVNNISGEFFHKGKRLNYLSQLQQCCRREMGELTIDETLLPNYII